MSDGMHWSPQEREERRVFLVKPADVLVLTVPDYTKVTPEDAVAVSDWFRTLGIEAVVIVGVDVALDTRPAVAPPDPVESGG